MIECPKCKNNKSVKHGFMKGKQRWKCKVCGCDYTRSDKHGYPVAMKRKAIKYYLEGIGFRRIGRLLEISDVTVLYWVRSLGRRLAASGLPKTGPVDLMELDELCTPVKKNRTKLGYGLLLREIPKRYWGRMLETVQK